MIEPVSNAAGDTWLAIVFCIPVYLDPGQQTTHNKELWTLYTCSPGDLGPPSQLAEAPGQ